MKMMNKFWARKKSTLSCEFTRASLQEAIDDAKLRIESGEDEEMVIVKIIKVVKRQAVPITVIDVD